MDRKEALEAARRCLEARDGRPLRDQLALARAAVRYVQGLREAAPAEDAAPLWTPFLEEG